MAPKTIKFYITSLKSFLSENDKEFPQKFWKHLMLRKKGIKGNRGLTLDRPPTLEELRKILSHMNIQGKALYMMLESSGMRIGEALKLIEQDISEIAIDNTKLTMIKLNGGNTKSGGSRVTFISARAKEFLDEWLRLRKKQPSYVKLAANQNTIPPIFSFDDHTARYVWVSAATKSGFGNRDNQTKRYEYHPHVLRKLFRSVGGKIIPVDIVEAIMGHEGYLTEVYRRYTTDDLARSYLKLEPNLDIYGGTQPITIIREADEELKDAVQSLRLEKVELQQKVDKLEKDFEKQNKDLGELKKVMGRLTQIKPGFLKEAYEKTIKQEANEASGIPE